VGWRKLTRYFAHCFRQPQALYKMKIDELTERENRLEKNMPSGGYFEERDEYLKNNKIYEENKSIFCEYVSLANKGNLEAIKRALFYLWYQCSEPNQLSGISELDERKIQSILLAVNKLSENMKLDVELKYMLPYYYQVCEWYFERFKNLEALLLASKENINLWEKEASKSKKQNRGKMGEYWSSKGV